MGLNYGDSKNFSKELTVIFYPHDPPLTGG
jgi:hypothetical protein